MKVKKFQATKMSDAMQRIKKELGSDAVILQSKEIKKGGFFGLFKKKYIEVIAALDEEQIQMPEPKQFSSSKINLNNHPETYDNREQVLSEIKQLKKLISTQGASTTQQFPPAYEYAYQYLLKQEIDTVIAERWIKDLLENEEDTIDVSLEEIKQQLLKMMEQEIQDVLEEQAKSPKRIIQFVGPTGVGKTTTLAKVAAKYMLDDRKKVAFITLDTYRIAAIEQLKTYANILNVPIEVAYSPQDYQKALMKFSQYDVLFVDTPGRNFRELQYIKDLKEITDIEQHQVSTFLVLSLTAKMEDVMDIYEQFTALPIEKVIFTKMDETLTYGSIINVMLKERKPVGYITNGQDVPDDLMEPSSSFIARHVFGRYHHE